MQAGRQVQEANAMQALGKQQQFPGGLRPVLSPRTLTLVAIGLLGIPAAVLLFFGVAEMAGGDVTGAQHFLQAAPLLAAIILAWLYPRRAGIGLVGLGLFLFVAWLILIAVSDVSGGSDLAMWIAAALILFLPPIVSGLLLLIANPKQPR